MSKHSVADAKNRLPALIDDALAGSEVIITRHGVPVVELRSVRASRPLNQSDLDWLAARRVTRGGNVDAGSLLRAMRDEE